MGPLTTPMQHAKAKELLIEIKKHGYKTLTGVIIPKADSETAAGGHFIHPTVVDRPPEDSAIVESEQFCAIVPLLEWSDEADLLKRVNASVYGLAATIWGAKDKDDKEDIEMAHRIAEGLECGTVWINQI